MNADERGSKIGRCAMAALLLFTASLGAAELWTRMGSVEVSGVDSGFRIREGRHEWKVDLSPLHSKYCAQICEGHPPCAACAMDSHILAWDEHNRRIFFTMGAGPSWEKPWAIYGYSLATRRFARFSESDAAYFEYGSVSYSGRYLGYLKSHHQSAAGPCRSQTDIEIVDLWNRRIGNPAVSLDGTPGCAMVDKLSWSSRSQLEYGGLSYSSNGVEVPGG